MAAKVRRLERPRKTVCVRFEDVLLSSRQVRSLQDKNQDMALTIKSLRSDCERMVQERGTYIEKVKGAEEVSTNVSL
eukprot:16242-Eustigmatos_ZCMA.PRE.1